MSLFSPLVLPCGTTIPNRIAKAAMEENMADADHAPSDDLIRLYEAWGRGGAGVIITGNVMVDARAMTGRGTTDGTAMRNGYTNLREHLGYIGWLAESRKWLAGASLSLADFAAAAHLSALDYIGDVDWSISPATKDWYAKVKSRPCFRALLNDRVVGMNPPEHYADLDF